MTLKGRYQDACATLTAAALLQPAILMAQEAPGDVAIASRSSDMVQRYAPGWTGNPF
jgi:hypothetical protein